MSEMSPPRPGLALRSLRQIAGLTVEQVATEAKVGTKYLTQVEAGERAPSPAWLAFVVRVLASHLSDREGGAR